MRLELLVARMRAPVPVRVGGRLVEGLALAVGGLVLEEPAAGEMLAAGMQVEDLWAEGRQAEERPVEETQAEGKQGLEPMQRGTK
jgi:hypothetical protein